jgi:DNA-directed RNA polymerase specialized sigma24 family protein
VDSFDGAGLLRACAASACGGARDHDEWSVLMSRFGARLESGTRRALRRAGMAARSDLLEDLLQEVSAKLWERRHSALRCFRGSTEAEAASYLRRMAENTALDALRRWSAQRRCGKPARVHDGALDELIDERAVDPERFTLEREQRRWLLHEVRALCSGRNARRNAWILRRALVDGWTAREIHGVLGSRAALTAIQALVFRARRRLAAGRAGRREERSL